MSVAVVVLAAAGVLIAAAAVASLLPGASHQPGPVRRACRWFAGGAVCWAAELVIGQMQRPAPGGGLTIADLPGLLALALVTAGLTALAAAGPGPAGSRQDQGAAAAGRPPAGPPPAGPPPAGPPATGRDAAADAPHARRAGRFAGGFVIRLADGYLLAAALFLIGWVSLFGADYASSGSGAGMFTVAMLHPLTDVAVLGWVLPLAVAAGRRAALPCLALLAVTVGDALDVAVRVRDRPPGIVTQLLLVMALAAVALTPRAGWRARQAPAQRLPRVFPAMRGRPGRDTAIQQVDDRYAAAMLAAGAAVAAALAVMAWGLAGTPGPGPVVALAGGSAGAALALRALGLSWQQRAVSRIRHEPARQFRELADRISDVVLLCDLDGAVRYASPAVAGYGYSPASLTGTVLTGLLHPEDRPRSARAARAVIAGTETAVKYPCRVRAADGTWRHVRASVSRYRYPGSPGQLLVTARDVSDQVALRRQVAHLTFHDGLTGLPNRAYVEDRARTALSGRPHGGAAGCHRAGAPEGAGRDAARVPSAPGEGSGRSGEAGSRADDAACAAGSRGAGDAADAGVAVRAGTAGGAGDDSRAGDAGTGDAAGAGAARGAEDAGAGAARGTGDARGAGVILLDLDGFTAVNDSAGHSAGDLILAQAARRLRAVVPPAGTVARWGGDEFAVLIEDSANAREVIDIAERLAASISAHAFQAGEQELSLTASVGVALADGSPPGYLWRNADAAMSRAKDAGGGRVEVHSPDRGTGAGYRLALAAELQDAIAAGSLSLRYQPVASLATGQVVSAVATVHMSRGAATVPASDLVAAAEGSGLIAPLGEWVLREACAQAGQWQRAGLTAGVWVTVSPAQAVAPGFAESVLASLAAGGLPPGALTLEAAERDLVTGAVVPGLAEVRARGVRLAAGGFGTDYGSLAYLRHRPVDVVAIDPSFVAGLGTDAELGTLVEAIIRVGRDLGIEVVAAGISSPAQLALLRAMGCPLGLGELVAPPVDARGMPGVLPPGRIAPPPAGQQAHGRLRPHDETKLLSS